MNNSQYYLLSLFAQIEEKLCTLTLLCPEHDLTVYNIHNLTQSENSRLLSKFMKQFCVGVENPAFPNKFELFTALRTYADALDEAILTDLLISVDIVLSKGVKIEDVGCQKLAVAYKTFLRSIDDIALAQVSRVHLGRN